MDYDKYRKVFAQRHRELRESRGLTQEEMGADIGYVKSSVATAETCKQSISLYYLLTAAEYFGVTPDYLLGFSDRKGQ